MAAIASTDPLMLLTDAEAEAPRGSEPLAPIVSISNDLLSPAPPDPPPVSTDIR